jgi:tripartite-type tricarboxylate transporter receptor subunit TctC
MPTTVFRLPHMTKTEFDPLNDFTWIINLTGYTFGVVVRADSPWKTCQEFIAYARANPGKLSYGTPGTSLHITMEDIAAREGVKLLHVPFKGNAEATAALLGGHITASADSTGWGEHRRCRKTAAARDMGCAAHEALAERADAQGDGLRHRLRVSIWDRGPQRHGSQNR